MAWYSDEEYELRQDNRDRSITARSARRARTHNGKGGPVKFPSDFMTAKERKAMNGECVSFELGKPMSWERFKSMPRDLQINYIKMIRHRFEPTDSAIAKMFGVCGRTLSVMLEDLKCRGAHTGGNRKWDKEKFEAWCRGEEIKDETTEEEVVEESIDIPAEEPNAENAPVEAVEAAEAANHKFKPVIPETGTLTFSGSADAILETFKGMLHNSKVILTVSWTVAGEE